MLTIPLILLLIAKKAHTIITLSALHDKIMVRYHKFLVSNVLVFFCVGVVALESFFTSFKQSSVTVLTVVGGSFPAAGPFYVGWSEYEFQSSDFTQLNIVFSHIHHGCSWRHRINPLYVPSSSKLSYHLANISRSVGVGSLHHIVVVC